MKIQRVMDPIVGSVLALLVSGAQAAEIKILASTAVRTTLEELAPQFEKASGHKLGSDYCWRLAGLRDWASTGGQRHADVLSRGAADFAGTLRSLPSGGRDCANVVWEL